MISEIVRNSQVSKTTKKKKIGKNLGIPEPSKNSYSKDSGKTIDLPGNSENRIPSISYSIPKITKKVSKKGRRKNLLKNEFNYPYHRRCPPRTRSQQENMITTIESH